MRTYINGTLYSVLAVPSMCRVAAGRGMRQLLEQVEARAPPTFARQVAHVITQLDKGTAAAACAVTGSDDVPSEALHTGLAGTDGGQEISSSDASSHPIGISHAGGGGGAAAGVAGLVLSDDEDAPDGDADMDDDQSPFDCDQVGDEEVDEVPHAAGVHLPCAAAAATAGGAAAAAGQRGSGVQGLGLGEMSSRSMPLGHHQVQAKAAQQELEQQRQRAGAAAAMYGEQLLCSFYLASIDSARWVLSLNAFY